MKKLITIIKSFFTADEIREVPHQEVPPRDQMVPNYNEFWKELNREIYGDYSSKNDESLKPKRKYTKKKKEI
jgi:hypothetical protein